MPTGTPATGLAPPPEVTLSAPRRSPSRRPAPRRLGSAAGSEPLGPGSEPFGPGPEGPSRRRRSPLVLALAAGGVLVIGAGVGIGRLALSEPETRSTATGGPTASSSPTETVEQVPQETPTGSPRPTGTPTKRPTTGRSPKAVRTQPTRKPTPAPTRSTRPSKPKTPTVPTGGMNASEAAVVTLTNKERAKAGCPALRADNRLVLSARRHSADMAANNYFSHTSRNGASPWARMEKAGYPSPGAENIAKGYPTAAAVMKGWMNSPGHRANILNCKLRAIGVGMAGGNGGPLWTQNFGWK